MSIKGNSMGGNGKKTELPAKDDGKPKKPPLPPVDDQPL
jgi:hypothetical protein